MTKPDFPSSGLPTISISVPSGRFAHETVRFELHGQIDALFDLGLAVSGPVFAALRVVAEEAGELVPHGEFVGRELQKFQKTVVERAQG